MTAGWSHLNRSWDRTSACAMDASCARNARANSCWDACCCATQHVICSALRRHLSTSPNVSTRRRSCHFLHSPHRLIFISASRTAAVGSPAWQAPSAQSDSTLKTGCQRATSKNRLQPRSTTLSGNGLPLSTRSTGRKDFIDYGTIRKRSTSCAATLPGRPIRTRAGPAGIASMSTIRMCISACAQRKRWRHLTSSTCLI